MDCKEIYDKSKLDLNDKWIRAEQKTHKKICWSNRIMCLDNECDTIQNECYFQTISFATAAHNIQLLVRAA